MAQVEMQCDGCGVVVERYPNAKFHYGKGGRICGRLSRVQPKCCPACKQPLLKALEKKNVERLLGLIGEIAFETVRAGGGRLEEAAMEVTCKFCDGRAEDAANIKHGKTCPLAW